MLVGLRVTGEMLSSNTGELHIRRRATREHGTMDSFPRNLGLPALAIGLALAPAPALAKPGAKLHKNAVTLVDFRSAGDGGGWRTINDGVMGGVSRSTFVQEGGRAVFEGSVSADNNGGFASVRAPARDLNLRGVGTVVVRVKGDGQRYRFNVRTDDRFDGVTYRHVFSTVKDEWIDVELAIADFEPTWRGRRVPGAPVLRAEDIRQLGFLIADNQLGPFRLEIESVTGRR